MKYCTLTCYMKGEKEDELLIVINPKTDVEEFQKILKYLILQYDKYDELETMDVTDAMIMKLCKNLTYKLIDDTNVINESFIYFINLSQLDIETYYFNIIINKFTDDNIINV